MAEIKIKEVEKEDGSIEGAGNIPQDYLDSLKEEKKDNG